MSERIVALLQHARNDKDFQAQVLQATPDQLSALGLKPSQQAVLLSNLLLTKPFEPGDRGPVLHSPGVYGRLFLSRRIA